MFSLDWPLDLPETNRVCYLLLININFAESQLTYKTKARLVRRDILLVFVLQQLKCRSYLGPNNATEANVASFTIHRQYDSCPCNRRFWLSCNARCQTTARFWRVHRSRDSQEFGKREESPAFEKSVPRKCKVRARISRSRPHEEGIVDRVSISAIFCR